MREAVEVGVSKRKNPSRNSVRHEKAQLLWLMQCNLNTIQSVSHAEVKRQQSKKKQSKEACDTRQVEN